MARGDKDIAAIVALTKKYPARAGCGMELANQCRQLRSRLLHEFLRRPALCKGLGLRVEHLGGGENHGLK
jgi:hypothetical protein